MSDGSVSGVVLLQTSFASGPSHVDVAEVHELVCGGVVHPHGLLRRKKGVTFGTRPEQGLLFVTHWDA